MRIGRSADAGDESIRYNPVYGIADGAGRGIMGQQLYRGTVGNNCRDAASRSPTSPLAREPNVAPPSAVRKQRPGSADLVIDRHGDILAANPALDSWLQAEPDSHTVNIAEVGVPVDALTAAAESMKRTVGSAAELRFTIEPLYHPHEHNSPALFSVRLSRYTDFTSRSRNRRDQHRVPDNPPVGAAIDKPPALGESSMARDVGFRKSLESSGLGLWQIDASQPDLFVWSPRMREIWGVGADEIITPTIAESLTHPDDRPRIYEALARALDPALDGSFYADHRICRPDGRTASVITWGHCSFKESSGIRGPGTMVGFALDVTEQRAAAAERDKLQEQIEVDHALLHAVVNQLPAEVVIADAQSGQTLLRNALAERPDSFASATDGADNQDTISQIVYRCGIPATHEDLPLPSALRSGHASPFEDYSIRGSDGRLRTVRSGAVPVIDRQGQPRAVVSLSHDITERKQLEIAITERLRRQQTLARLSREALASRDLRALFDGAIAEICQTTHAYLGVIAELEPDSDHCVIRSTAGHSGQAEGCELACTLDALCCCVAAGEGPRRVEPALANAMLSCMSGDHPQATGAIIVPIATEDQRFGTIATFSHCQPPGEEDVVFVDAVANILALAVQIARNEQLERRRSTLLLSTLHAFTDSPGLRGIQVSVLAHLRSLLGCHSVGCWLYDARTHSMRLMMTVDDSGRACEPETDHPLTGAPISVSQLPVWECLQSSNDPLFVGANGPIPQVLRDWYASRRISGALILPMRLDDQTVGWLVARCETTCRFSREQRIIAQSLTQRAAMAIYMEQLAEAGNRTAIIAERNRLAREIHDTIAQGLAAIALQLEAAGAEMQRDPDKAMTRLRMAQEIARQNLAEARRSVWALRPPNGSRPNLEAAFREAVSAVTRGSGVSANMSFHGAERILPEDVELDLLRIGVEAVTNSVKHSGTDHVEVAVTFGHRRLWLKVTDRGTGFDMRFAAIGSYGIAGMQERAARIGASLTIRSAPGDGTSVEVALLYPTAERKTGANE